jgi:hypothetical protein
MDQIRILYDEKTQNAVLLTKFLTETHLIQSITKLLSEFKLKHPGYEPFLMAKICKFKTKDELENAKLVNNMKEIEYKSELKKQIIRPTTEREKTQLRNGVKPKNVLQKRNRITDSVIVIDSVEMTNHEQQQLEISLNYEKPKIIGCVDDDMIVYEKLEDFCYANDVSITNKYGLLEEVLDEADQQVVINQLKNQVLALKTSCKVKDIKIKQKDTEINRLLSLIYDPKIKIIEKTDQSIETDNIMRNEISTQTSTYYRTTSEIEVPFEEEKKEDNSEKILTPRSIHEYSDERKDNLTNENEDYDSGYELDDDPEILDDEDYEDDMSDE